MGPRRQVAHVVVLCVVLALVSCTTGTPTPAPSVGQSPTSDAAPVEAIGDRVAVVVGPSPTVPPAEAAALETAARALAEDPPEGVIELRVVVAEDGVFAVDLVGLFAGDGYDVVCVVGTGAASLAVEAARLHRGVRVCATDPAISGGPANVVAAAVDPAAFVALAGAMTRRLPPPVGLLTVPPVGTAEELGPQLSSLLPEPAPATPSPRPSPSPQQSPQPSPTDGRTASPTPSEPPPPAVVGVTLDAATTAAAVDRVSAAGAAATVLLAPGSEDVVAELAAEGRRSIVVDDWVRAPGAVVPPGVMAAIIVDRGALLRRAVAAARERGGSQVRLLRLADGVLGVRRGPARGGGTLMTRGQQAIDEATAGE